jgi:hypothetical protein
MKIKNYKIKTNRGYKKKIKVKSKQRKVIMKYLKSLKVKIRYESNTRSTTEIGFRYKNIDYFIKNIPELSYTILCKYGKHHTSSALVELYSHNHFNKRLKKVFKCLFKRKSQ